MKYKWHLFWAIIILCVIGTGGLAMIAYNSPPPLGSSVFIEVTKTVSLCLGGLGVILPLYINATNAVESRMAEKIENTFRLIEKWDDPHLFSARKLTREIKEARSSLSDNDLVKRIKADEELKQSVILVSNYFEQVRFSVVNNRIDVAQFRLILGPVITDIITRFEPYFKTFGQEYMDDLRQLVTLMKG
ncbi:DUF4760 domain-containing protein [Escherichia coli]|uniref:DUF4760 domain-containing protein n=1 Tax=Escherichia TaxID=561 RepID=UPI0003EE6FE5|nr:MULTISPECIES: hypothetical protein [Escherichia]HBN3401673.1 DUF4760 domain-containing protein [Escherichia coli O25b:H4-ST131]EHL7982505.1 DUF4760 domain-containing protein [Escherichia coli]EHN4351329.1 DUF4760 domain-containing protein [Escherichia coli]EHO1951192.1 DUF4760 domain-containing protein [Escherichia coli]EHO1995469.1 DUF4760 domain-containing protein [Escherichia coli]